MPRLTAPDGLYKMLLGLGSPETLTDAVDRECFYFVKGQAAQSEAIREKLKTAYEIYADPEFSTVLNALILCQAVPAEVEESLELEEGVYDIYRRYFFNREFFKNAFSIRKYAAEHPCDAYELVFTEGARRLLDKYRVKGPAPIAPDAVLNEMLSETYSRAAEHRGRPITSRTAQEALKWGRAAAGIAVDLKTVSNQSQSRSALEALTFALTTVDKTSTPEELNLSSDDFIKG